MPKTIEGLVHSEIRRRKRRAADKMNTALGRLRDAMLVMQNSANELAQEYERLGMREAQKKANQVVNALRSADVFTPDELNIRDDILSQFNALPDEA